MKKVLFLLSVLALVACNTQQKTETTSDETSTVAAEWVEVTLEVEGMTCDGCESAINAGVEKLEGIASVESSHEEAWTKVKFDAKATSVDDIKEKITETGYVVKQVLP